MIQTYVRGKGPRAREADAPSVLLLQCVHSVCGTFKDVTFHILGCFVRSFDPCWDGCLLLLDLWKVMERV